MLTNGILIRVHTIGELHDQLEDLDAGDVEILAGAAQQELVRRKAGASLASAAADEVVADRAHKDFGARVKAKREFLGLSQEELAQRSRLAADTIRRAEHGAFSPSLRTLIKMAAGFGVPVHTLLYDDVDQADELAECIRSLPQHEFRIACSMVRVLVRLATGHPAGEG